MKPISQVAMFSEDTKKTHMAESYTLLIASHLAITIFLFTVTTVFIVVIFFIIVLKHGLICTGRHSVSLGWEEIVIEPN